MDGFSFRKLLGLDDITISPWNHEIECHDNQHQRKFSISKYRYRDIIVHIIQIVKHPLQKTKFLDIWYKVYHMLVMLVLMCYYNQLNGYHDDIHNKSSYLKDDYHSTKFQYHLSTFWKDSLVSWLQWWLLAMQLLWWVK